MKHLRKFMFTAAGLFAVLSVIFLISHIHHDNHYSFTCFITFLTCFYHFAYRIAVSELTEKLALSFNFSNGWFAPKKFEEPVFKLLRVKRWKEKLPNLLPQTSSAKDFPVETLINETCTVEVIHEINILLSFVPFIVSLFYSSHEWIFLVSGIITALFDLCFIIFHRHFRPRLIKLLNTKA